MPSRIWVLSSPNVGDSVTHLEGRDGIVNGTRRIPRWYPGIAVAAPHRTGHRRRARRAGRPGRLGHQRAGLWGRRAAARLRPRRAPGPDRRAGRGREPGRRARRLAGPGRAGAAHPPRAGRLGRPRDPRAGGIAGSAAVRTRNRRAEPAGADVAAPDRGRAADRAPGKDVNAGIIGHVEDGSVMAKPGSVFSEAELAYLHGQRRLGRVATIGADGTPHVTPVGWAHNAALDTIDVTGHGLEQTKKFRDAERTGRAAIVIDDLASVSPWRPRAIEVRGRAEALRTPQALIRIHPERIISWGLGPGRSARTVTRPGAP